MCMCTAIVPQSNCLRPWLASGHGGPRMPVACTAGRLTPRRNVSGSFGLKWVATDTSFASLRPAHLKTGCCNLCCPRWIDTPPIRMCRQQVVHWYERSTVCDLDLVLEFLRLDRRGGSPAKASRHPMLPSTVARSREI